jgi:hypothetical protein
MRGAKMMTNYPSFAPNLVVPLMKSLPGLREVNFDKKIFWFEVKFFAGLFSLWT